MASNEYELFLSHVNNLTERRQNITATYLSVNAALTGVMAFLFKDGQLPGLVSQIAVLTLLFSGIVACGLWRRLITQYSTLINWWYEQLRALEDVTAGSKKLITREFQELYRIRRGKKERVGLTRYEIRLTWIFTAIYSVFGIAILVAAAFHLH